MTASISQVDALLRSGSENPKRVISTFNAEPTKPISNKHIDPEAADAFIREHYSKLSGDQIDSVTNFLQSDAGRKQRDLSAEFSKQVRALLSSNNTPDLSVTSAKAEKVKAFFKASGAEAAKDRIPTPSDSTKRKLVEDFAVKFYGENLTDEELDELIAYYTSPEGKVAVEAATNLSAAIAAQYGL